MNFTFGMKSSGSATYAIDGQPVPADVFWSEWMRVHIEGAEHGDLTSAQHLEDEIDRRGSWEAYTRALCQLCDVTITSELEGYHTDWVDVDTVRFLIRATPEQRAAAFLKAINP